MPDTHLTIGAGLRIVNRPDHLDIEQLDAMLLSGGWALFLRKLNAIIEGERAALESVDAKKLAYVQGKLAALKLVKTLPEILRQEVKARTGG